MKFASILLLILRGVLSGAVVFEPNRGQVSSTASFVARTGSGAVEIRAGALGKRGTAGIALEGARTPGQLEARKPLSGVSHYALGRTPSSWIYDVPRYEEVAERDVYPGVDVIYHGNGAELEFDFEVAAGRSVEGIQLRFGETISLSAEGGLRAGSTTLRRPMAWQTSGGRRHGIPVEFRVLEQHVAGFRLGKHDRNLPIAIDPVIDFATFLGGTGNEADTWVTAGATGEVYAAGSTTSVDFPSAPADPSPGPTLLFNTDVYVTRLSPNGATIEWTLFLGGMATDRCAGLKHDSAGNLYVYGVTASPDFPVTAGAWKTGIEAGIRDKFVVKLDGRTGHVLASTFLGLLPANDGSAGGAFAVSPSGDVLISSMSTSNSFEATAGVYGPVRRGPALVRLRPDLRSVVYATYVALGTVDVLAVDEDGSAVFGGTGQSSVFEAFPAIRPIPGINQKAYGFYVARLNGQGTALIYASLFNEAAGFGGLTDVAVDETGNAYLTGYAEDFHFPQVNPVLVDGKPPDIPTEGRNRGGWPFLVGVPREGGRFVSATLLFGQEFGSSGFIKLAIRRNRVCVTGLASRDFKQTSGGLVGIPAPANFFAHQPGSSVACLDETGRQFEIKTYLPYTGRNYRSVAVSADGGLFFGGESDGSLQTTPGVAQPAYGGDVQLPEQFQDSMLGDSFVIKVAVANPPPQITSLSPDSIGLPTSPRYGTYSFDVFGTGLAAGTSVTVNGEAVKPTFYSTAHMAIEVPANSFRAGANEVIASTAGPGGGISLPFVITGVNTGPGRISLSPSTVNSGGGPTKITITGDDLAMECLVTWGGSARPATYRILPTGGNALEITATAADLAVPGTFQVAVSRPGVLAVATAPFVVAATTGELIPTLVSPGFLPAGSSKTLLLRGFGFSSASRVYWNGKEIPFQGGSSSFLTVTPPVGSLARPGTHEVYVTNGKYFSNTIHFHVGPTMKITGSAFDPVRQRIYVLCKTSEVGNGEWSLRGYSTDSGEEVVVIPNVLNKPLAVGVSEGGFVYVGGGTSGMEVVRVNVSTGVVDLNFRVALPPLGATGSIQTILAVPGLPETVAIQNSFFRLHARSLFAGAEVDRSITIYDGDRPRSLTSFDSGIVFQPKSRDYAANAIAVFATTNRVILAGQAENSARCWMWVDFDSLGVRKGSTQCGPEPAELIHDHNAVYLSDGGRSYAVSVLESVSSTAGVILGVEPALRTAYALVNRDFTAVNLDTGPESVSTLTPYAEFGEAPTVLYVTRKGPWVVTNVTLFPVP